MFAKGNRIDGKVFFISFVFKRHFEVVIDSRQVAKHTGKFYAPFSQHPSMLLSYTTILHYQKQETGIGTTHKADSGLSSYAHTHLGRCVYISSRPLCEVSLGVTTTVIKTLKCAIV